MIIKHQKHTKVCKQYLLYYIALIQIKKILDGGQKLPKYFFNCLLSMTNHRLTVRNSSISTI